MRGLPTVFALAFVQLVVIGCSPNPQSSAGLTAEDSVALRKIADRDAPIVLAHQWDTLGSRVCGRLGRSAEIARDPSATAADSTNGTAI